MEFAFDSELAATDNDRRCERRAWETVGHRQEMGTIRPEFHTSGFGRLRHDVPVASEVTEDHSSIVTDFHSMATTAPEDFDVALEEVKAEGIRTGP
jgi:hypothetical protein